MNILFTINKNYYSPLLTCLYSIVDSNINEELNIFIAHQGLTDNEEFELNLIFSSYNIKFKLITITEEMLEDFPQNNRYPKMMYARLFAHEYLPTSVDKILYLDPDIIVINPLKNLYEMSFENNYFIGSSHTGVVLTKLNQQRLDANKDAYYINTGVLMINLKLTREFVRRNDVINYILKKEKLLYLPDQDILSALYGHKTRLVSELIYNLSESVLIIENMKIHTSTITIKWIEKNTVIIHYTGKNKPWLPNYIGILDKYYHNINTQYNE